MSRRRRILLGVSIAIVAGLTGLYFSGPGQAFKDLWHQNVIQGMLSKPAERDYEPGRVANLKALRVAMMLYHDSEGQFPAASGWMDAIKNHLRTTDMSDQEAKKKLIRPNVLNPGPSDFGYAMNDAASQKYKGDIKDQSMPLIYESPDLKWDAHGTPVPQDGLGISVAGEIVKLK